MAGSCCYGRTGIGASAGLFVFDQFDYVKPVVKK